MEVNHGADLLSTPDDLGSWLRAHELIDDATRVGDADLARALAIREGLRAVARGDGQQAIPELNEAASGAPVELQFDPVGPRFVVSRGDAAGALGLLLALAAGAMLDGNWRRLKVCPGEDCGWVFFDHSRNQSGRWCSMSVCGGRSKARAHYRRNRGGG
jgi:predicted RNA-binding Zn ribbon-like protein